MDMDFKGFGEFGGPFHNLCPPPTTKFSSNPPNSPNPLKSKSISHQPCPFPGFLTNPFSFDLISMLDLPTFPQIPDSPDPSIHNFLQQDINRNPHQGHTQPVQGCIFCPTLDLA